MLNQIPPPTFSNVLISMAQRPLTSGHLLCASFLICKMGRSPPEGCCKDYMGNAHKGPRAQDFAPLLLGAGDGISSASTSSSRSTSSTQDSRTQVKKQTKKTFWPLVKLLHISTKEKAARTPLGLNGKEKRAPQPLHTQS